MQSYAANNRFVIVQEYVDVETAKTAGRTNFEQMVRYLKTHTNVRTLLVEKTDRLYRNLRDWVTLDELDIDIHLVKEGIILSRDSKSSEKFVHGIKVLMAKNYIDNLSEEARKGMQEKAEQGIWPTYAPLGYLNVVGPDGKKTIAPDPQNGPIIAHLFGWYATGTLSLKEAAEEARSAGLVYRTGKPVPTSTVHANISLSSPASFGSACKAFLTPATPARSGAASTISPSRALSTAGIVAAPWSGNSRKAATSTTIAPATRGNAASHMCVRKSSPRNSLKSLAG
jgi:DNA invertase Pin-like site-specific DNA recombinase